MHEFEVMRLRKVGATNYLGINEKLMRRMRWNTGDCMVLRCVDSKLVIERIPVEQLAKLRARESDAGHIDS